MGARAPTLIRPGHETVEIRGENLDGALNVHKCYGAALRREQKKGM